MNNANGIFQDLILLHKISIGTRNALFIILLTIWATALKTFRQLCPRTYSIICVTWKICIKTNHLFIKNINFNFIILRDA
jgi:hypothetical protein